MGKAVIITAGGSNVIEIEDIAYEPTREEIIAEKQAAIESYKTQIASSDYKIIKCAEAQILGVEMPYDVASLHVERQALRDKINKIEVELEKM